MRILVLVALSCLASLALAWRGLPYSSDRTHLLPLTDPRQQRYEAYRQAFPAQGREVVILLEGLDAAARLKAADALADDLNHDPCFENALGSIRAEGLRSSALFLMDPTERSALLKRLQGGFPDWGQLFLQSLRERSNWHYVSPLGPAPPDLSDELALALGSSSNLVLVQVREGVGPSVALGRLDLLLDRLRARFPGLSTQPSGDFAVRTDDAVSTRQAALVAVLLAIALVKLLFWAVFGDSARSFRAFLSVVVGMIWATGFAALTVGRLNLITVNFLATLVGLGMDFALQLIFRYEEEGDWPRTLRRAGRENLLGALATAAAFGSLCFTDFQGVAELGWISGWGVLFCFASTHLLLPRMVSGRRGQRLTFLRSWERGWLARRALVLALAGLASLGALWGCRYLSFDANLLHMARPGALSIQSQVAFQRAGGRSVLFAVSLAPDQETMRRREAAFRALPEVAGTVSLSRLLPPDSPEVAQILALAHGLKAPDPPRLRSAAELLKLRRGGGEFDRLGPGPIQDALYGFDSAVYADVRGRLDFLAAQQAHPLRLEDLPGPYRSRYYGQGKWLIQVYARPDLWDKAQLDAFLARLRQIDPDVTGMPTLVQAYTSILSECYFQAGRNALITVVVLLLLYFRSPLKALWALLPKLLGALWMFGAMGWLNIPLNPANATALPLTLGVGLMFGVHVVHRRGPLFEGSTGAAVTVSGLSTVCGYLALLTVPHRGIASLGLVMAMGVLANLVAALVVLPCLAGTRPAASE